MKNMNNSYDTKKLSLYSLKNIFIFYLFGQYMLVTKNLVEFKLWSQETLCFGIVGEYVHKYFVRNC
jgi:hypothetical protein